MEEDRKASARALRTFDGAPKGYWWIVGALVALASAAMLLHESGSWMLDLAPLWGAPVNIRAFSCDAHSLGLVFGYVATQICGRRFSRFVGDGLFWLVFFIAQVGNILLFYGCLTVLDAPFVVIVVQFIGAASGAWFFVVASQVACTVGSTLFMGTIVAVVALTTLIVQGLFSMLEATSSLLVSELLHVGLVVAAAAVPREVHGSWLLFSGELPSLVRAHSCPRGRRGGGARSIGQRVSPMGWGRMAPRHRAVGCLCASGSSSSSAPTVWCSAFSMSFRWRCLWALWRGWRRFSWAPPSHSRSSSLTLRRGRAVDVSLIWNRFYRFVFPAVCVAALLGPLTNSSEFLPALIMQACALYYFDALLAMACSVISRAINAAPSQIFGRAFLIRSVGFLLGNLVGMEVHENLVLDTAAFSVIGTAVFVLLVLVTFNMNSEKYAKTVWGLLPHEDPRGRYERTRDERCSALADQFGLTERETEVLRLLARNKRPREISDVLVVSVATVRSHVHAIYTKTGVHSAAELAKLVECPQDKS